MRQGEISRPNQTNQEVDQLQSFPSRRSSLSYSSAPGGYQRVIGGDMAEAWLAADGRNKRTVVVAIGDDGVVGVIYAFVSS